MEEEFFLSQQAREALSSLLGECGLEDKSSSSIRELRELFSGYEDEQDNHSWTEIQHYRSCGIPPFLSLCLVGQHHSLWGHKLWSSAIYLADRYDTRIPPFDITGKTVLEFGAGAGLPSLTCALNGAQCVVATDYGTPSDTSLIDALQENIRRLESGGHIAPGSIQAFPYIWGNNPQRLLDCLPNTHQGFDVLILTELLFNRSEHIRLLQSCHACLAEFGIVWVGFIHNDPERASLDLKFFELAREAPFYFVVEKLGQIRVPPMFEQEDGLEEMRSTTHLYVMAKSESVITQVKEDLVRMKNQEIEFDGQLPSFYSTRPKSSS